MSKKIINITITIAILAGTIVFSPTTFSANGFSVEPFDQIQMPAQMKEKILAAKAKNKSRGSGLIPDEEFHSMNRVVEKMEKQKGYSPSSLNDIVNAGKLKNPPSSVANTVLAHASLIRAHISGGYQNGQWSGLSRVYK